MSRVSAPLVGQGKAASVAQHVGMSEQGREATALYFRKSKLTVEAVQRFALLAYKERLAGRFHLATFF
jgi:hypothetical protein